MTSQELDALHHALPTGQSNATSVRALAYELEWSDRKVRQGFQALRRDRHVPICALPITNGVFVATKDDMEALQRTRDGLRSRAMSELVTVKDLDQTIADMSWQPTLFASN